MLARLLKKEDEKSSDATANSENEGTGPPFQEEPKICLIDVDQNAEEALATAGYNLTVGSFGSLVSLPNVQMGDKCNCLLSPTLPPNLHEYDVVVVDLKDREPIQYDAAEHQPKAGKGATQHSLLCEFPQTIFDPRPLVAHIVKSAISEIQGRESIIVVFASAYYEVTYHPIVLTRRGFSRQDSLQHDNYSFLPFMPSVENKTGLETKTVQGRNIDFTEFLRKHDDAFTYEITFAHPTRWEGEAHGYVKDPRFMPLVANAMEQIVSFARIDNESILFIFPQLEDKTSFLLELFQCHLPAILPSLFPFSTQFAWIKNEEYRLPNEARLLAEKEAIEQEYAEKIAIKEREHESNYQQYRFLHDLLTGTGATLVKAVEYLFRWLEFDDVINCDETYPGRNEEDLQVVLDDRLLVVEAKGIGGTSKDSECSQVSKIRHRRVRERKSFDVFALYIVNHQRYLPPENRKNPPFTQQQVDDAENDERGLLTTYDLFKLFFAVDSGFITKEDARESLLNYGMVAFRPSNAESIGKPLEIHYGGTVGIFLLQGVLVSPGDRLLVCENGWYREAQILGLRDHDEDTDVASEGEIGMKLSEKVSESSELWKLEH